MEIYGTWHSSRDLIASTPQHRIGPPWIELERCLSLRLSNATYGATELAPDGFVTDSTRIPGTVAAMKAPVLTAEQIYLRFRAGSAPSSLAQTSSGNNLPGSFDQRSARRLWRPARGRDLLF